MKLRYITLWIDQPSYSGFKDEQFIFEFNKNTEFISDYITKTIRKYHYETDGTYKMISIKLCTENGGCEIRQFDPILRAYKGGDILSVRLVVTQSEIEKYQSMSNTVDRCEFYLGLLQRGYQMAQSFKVIPINELLDIHQQFRDNGYKNEWLFKKMRITQYNMVLYFKCYFTTSEFRLELEAYDIKTKELISSGIIKETFPDELCFAKSFKKVIVENNKLTILDFLSKPAFEIDLDMIKQGVFNVNDVEGLWWHENS